MKNLPLLAIILLLLIRCQSGTTSSTALQTSLRSSSSIVYPVDYEYPAQDFFSVLSWNVEHFVDEHDDPYIQNNREDNPPENMNIRRRLLIKALKEADADVVVLQEFESARYLRKLVQDELPDMGYRFFADAPSQNWYMNVVLMSRLPLGLMTSYGRAYTPLPGYTNDEGLPETQQRINTRMWTIQVLPKENFSFWLTGVHLKAGRGDRNVATRLGQINLVTHHMNELMTLNPEANLLMVGDFNAYPSSKELSALKEENDNFKGFIDPLDTAAYTHPANEPVRRLDYILYNQNMDWEIRQPVEVRRFFSLDSMRMISDHLPVLAHFFNQDK